MIRTKLNQMLRAGGCGACLAALFPLSMDAQITVASSPVGVMSKGLAQGETGLAFPLIAENVFVGIAAGNSSNVVTFPESEGDIGTVLDAGGRYYLEVVAGPLEGERFDVDVFATIAAGDSTVTLDLGAASFSTMSSLGGDVLDGALCVMRPHVTLSSVQEMVSPALTGSNQSGSADGVHIYGASDYSFYYLQADGESWGSDGVAGDLRDQVIPPDVSIKIELRSGAKAWLHEGVVRANAFRKNLVAGTQALATGFPEALSPVELGAFVDPQAPAGTRWTGSAEPEEADWIRRVLGHPLPFNWFYLDASGTTWRRVAQKTNVTSTPFVGPTEALVLRRNNPDAGYLILRPFEL